MADELQLVTTNAADDGWVDGVPGAVSTGYQAQNTVLQALFNGLDKSSVRIDGANLKIDPSGVIDDSGLPFVVQSAITLALPTTGAANWFLKVVAGSTALERSIEFTDDRGTYDASKNGFYNTGGERVLNWCYNRYSKTLTRVADNNEFGEHVKQDAVNSFIRNDDAVRGLLGSMYRILPISGGVTCKGLAYYNGYLYNLGDNVQKYDLDGTLVDTITVGALVGHTCSTIDPTTGNLVRIKVVATGGGGIPAESKTYATIYVGISSSVGSTVEIGTNKGGTSAAINAAGDLMIFDTTYSNPKIYIYDGISSSEITNFVPDNDTKMLGFDFWLNSFFGIEIDASAETELPIARMYSGNTSTTRSIIALICLFDRARADLLAAAGSKENGEIAVAFGTNILRLGAS